MSGFDLTELLPFYLDETDEQIAALNDALLKLEVDASDAPVLREAFRMVHSIKGASAVMGLDQVKDLTHHLESYFDQLRALGVWLEAECEPAALRGLADVDGVTAVRFGPSDVAPTAPPATPEPPPGSPEPTPSTADPAPVPEPPPQPVAQPATAPEPP